MYRLTFGEVELTSGCPDQIAFTDNMGGKGYWKCHCTTSGKGLNSSRNLEVTDMMGSLSPTNINMNNVKNETEELHSCSFKKNLILYTTLRIVS